jgi:predicted RNase H-like HicB family nuclease
MQIPVLIEPVAGNGYVARAGSPFDWSAEGATQDEALQKLQAVVAAKVAAGARVATVETPPPTDPLAELRAKGVVIGPLTPPTPGEHPLLRFAGTMDPNDPVVQEWKKAIEEYRQEVDNDPDRL